MKFSPLLIVVPMILLVSCSYQGLMPQPSQNTQTSMPVKYQTGISEKEKISLALERKKELRTIRKGDYMTLKNSPEQAIVYYSAVLEKLPDDIVVRRKIAHVYFLTKDWKRAYENYARVPMSELKGNEQTELFLSLFSDDARPDRLIELSKYPVERDLMTYYQVMDRCYAGANNCVEALNAYSGSNTLLMGLKNILPTVTQVSPDLQYRNFRLATILYTQSMYRLVDIITTEILSARPNYVEVRKLKGFALYELGRYTAARDMILSYLEDKPNDFESIIRLGDIYARLGDPNTSNLYLNNVITGGYAKKTEIERRLATNYAALDDTESMVKVLSYLLQETDATEDDFAVAISLALREGQPTRAYSWAYNGVTRFQNSPVLIPLYLTALRTNAKIPESLSYVESLGGDLRKNPLIELEYAIALYESGRYDDALPIFESIEDLDATADWGVEAANYIQLISDKQSHPIQDTIDSIL